MNDNRFIHYLLLVLLGPIFVLTACKTKSENTKVQLQSSANQAANPPQEQVVSIHQAALDGNLKAVSMLVDNGLKVDTLDQDGRTALMFAAYNGHTTVLKKLIQSGASVNLADMNGTTALMMASSGPYPQAVQLLLDSRADPNIIDKAEHFTALMYAASEGQLEVVKLVLAYGADPTLKDIDGDDAITFAGRNKHPEVVNFLKSFTYKAGKK